MTNVLSEPPDHFISDRSVCDSYSPTLLNHTPSIQIRNPLGAVAFALTVDRSLNPPGYLYDWKVETYKALLLLFTPPQEFQRFIWPFIR